MPVGFRVLQRRRKNSDETISEFRDLPVANISDSMARMSAGGPLLRPMHGSATMIGSALTVKTRPGDNLMVHQALKMAEAGDVIVVDAGGDLTNALIGELMISYAMKKGVAGFVINGAIRDSNWVRANSIPVFAAGVTHRGPYKDGPGEINVPIALGGMVIEPGDLIVGDDDGFVSVPFDLTHVICESAKAKRDAEARTLVETQAGKLDPKTWVDEALRRGGCEFAV
jgi:RraA family protein